MRRRSRASTGRRAGESPTPDPSGVGSAGDRGAVHGGRLARGRHGVRCARATTGSMGRIEAPDARTVVFTLCEPDGALPRPSSRTRPWASWTPPRSSAWRRTPRPPASLAGTGPYRIDAWTPGENVRLVLGRGQSAAAGQADVSRPSSCAGPPTRPSGRSRSSRRPSTASTRRARRTSTGSRRCPSWPSLARNGLATAYLGFGTGSGLGKAAVRRALAGSLDRDDARRRRVRRRARPRRPTSRRATSRAAAAGRDWYGFNAPAASAALAAAGFDLDDRDPAPRSRTNPSPGLPDPAGLAAAIRDQLDDEPRPRTSSSSRSPVGDYQADLAAGKLDGLYLGGVASTIADPAAFLAPAVREGRQVHARGAHAEGRRAPSPTPARRPTRTQRAEAFARANEAIRDAASLIPLAHPGSAAAFRDRRDRTSATSPIGLDPLGSFTPGRSRASSCSCRRPSPTAPTAATRRPATRTGCAACVQEGLYGFQPGTMTVEPRLAQRVRARRRRDGLDVPAARRRQVRRRGPLRRRRRARLVRGPVGPLAARCARARDAPFAAWNELFGGHDRRR